MTSILNLLYNINYITKQKAKPAVILRVTILLEDRGKQNIRTCNIEKPEQKYRLGTVNYKLLKDYNQLLQLCTARTAWSESEQGARANWRLGPLWSDLVIKLVSVLIG